ncbi:MAG: radical SAM protein [Bacteroidales bacterium]
MNIGEIHGKSSPLLLKYKVGECPHLTIETNLICNIKCRGCYNINKTYIKDLDLIHEEIDTGIHKRDPQSITLIGGEPTLHPDLVNIIRYIKQKGMVCQMLTNGIQFLEDEKDFLLHSLVDAGLDKILLHVDEGQEGIHDDLDLVIDTLFEKFEKVRIWYSLSTTVFNDTQQRVAEKLRRYAGRRYFDGILALLMRDCETSIQSTFNESAASTMRNEYEGIFEAFHIAPLAYIPTSLDDREISWLFYFYYINANTGEVFSRSVPLIRIFFRVYRFFSGKAAFGLNYRGGMFYIVFIVSSLLELIINPLRIPSFIRLISGSKMLTALRIHTLVIQNPPQYHPEKNQFHLCYHCPDATIRNGKLTPLCLADIINPLGADENLNVPEEIYRTVYKHMGEPV